MKQSKWDSIARAYSEDFGDEGDYSHKYVIHPAVLNNIDNIRGSKILDLGSGTGSLTRILAKLGANVTAIDFSKEMLNISIRKTREQGLSITHIQKDLEKPLIFNNNTFDIITQIMVLHSISDINNIISGTYNALKNGGICISVIPHPCFLKFFTFLEKDAINRYLSQNKSYFTHSKWNNSQEKEIPKIEFYSRPIQDYIQNFLDIGFTLHKFSEPKISKEAIYNLDERRTMEVYNRRREFPSFLLMIWKKQ